jgi:hypothetical protein
MRKASYKHSLLFLITTFICSASFAQSKKIIGFIKDKQSDEPIPFVSVFLQSAKTGRLTDTLGRFSIVVDFTFKTDTLKISSVGYKIVSIPISLIKDSASFVVHLEVLPPSGEAVVKSKYNRALWFWKRIIKNKLQNDKTRWDNYAYEIYNKLELDLNNVNKEKLGNNKLLKPLNFLLSYVDSTSESTKYLPIFLTETLSDYYFQKSPERIREYIKATKTNGIENESIIKELGGMYQNINVYKNFLPVFDKQFISPLNDNGEKYYNFKLLDTQYLNKKRLVHLRFTPKQKGADVFEGDCWVNDTSYAIQKITLRPSVDANINYISGLTLIQEFKLIQDSIWFLYKDKFVADIAPIGKSKLALIGRKTTTYKNVVFNNTSITTNLQQNKKAQQVDLNTASANFTDSFWTSNRHEQLNKNETTIYKVWDTLNNNPTFKLYRGILRAVALGTQDIGNITIGPWFYWLSANPYEGIRTRFDVATNTGFNKNLYLHGYMAYGFSDKRYKGTLEMRYLFNRNPWTYLHLSYRNDIDNGQVYYDQLGSDNIFATWFRRPGIPFKMQRAEEIKAEFFKETNSGFSFGAMASSKAFESLINLPDQSFFPVINGTPLKTFETSFRIKYAYAERFLSDNFYRASLGSSYPIVDFRFTQGWPGVLKSSYRYDKIDLTVSDDISIAPFGRLNYNLFGGKVYGIVPFQFLELLPGNEMYYYNRYAFNLMNRFEYVADAFAGFSVEHNIGSGLFRYIPLTRKLKFRQFYSVKGVTGNINDENKKLNFVGNYPYKSLDNKMYWELSTGVDNIFKLFRVDFVWRVLTEKDPKIQTSNFGVFGSFRISF